MGTRFEARASGVYVDDLPPIGAGIPLPAHVQDELRRRIKAMNAAVSTGDADAFTSRQADMRAACARITEQFATTRAPARAFVPTTAGAARYGVAADAPPAAPPSIRARGPTIITQRGGEAAEKRAFMHYIRKGEVSPELRASNDTDMNVGTPADGGYAVPTGLYNQIVAKRNEAMLARVLGVQTFPGKGTTVNVPVETGSANEFVAVGEGQPFDRDAPVLGQVPMTLVMYTKRIQLSFELLEDEDAALEAYLANYVGRAWAMTHNSLLIAEALANGTPYPLVAIGAATTADIPGVAYALPEVYAEGAQWVMARTTEGAYRSLTGNAFLFANTPAGSGNSMLGYPVRNSEFVEVIGAGGKSILFGNFDAGIGLREGAGLSVLRDPYSSAGTGQVNLWYYFRACYKTLDAAALVVGTHPS